MQDLAEDLISPVTAREIYQVAFDQQTRVLDREETARQRDAERQARLARGKPYDQFVQQWQTAEPPAHLPYFGSWDDPTQIYGVSMGQRVKMDADKLVRDRKSTRLNSSH